MKKETKVKGRGRELTLGSRKERDSRLRDKHTDECTAERKLKEWRVQK